MAVIVGCDRIYVRLLHATLIFRFRDILMFSKHKQYFKNIILNSIHSIEKNPTQL